MKGTNLGELEEVVLLIVGVVFDNAYGISIQEALVDRCNRKAILSDPCCALRARHRKPWIEV